MKAIKNRESSNNFHCHGGDKTGSCANWHRDIFLISFLWIAKLGRKARSTGDREPQLAWHLLEGSCGTADDFCLVCWQRHLLLGRESSEVELLLKILLRPVKRTQTRMCIRYLTKGTVVCRLPNLILSDRMALVKLEPVKNLNLFL